MEERAGDRTGALVLLRHGESTSNAAKEFSGRHDVDVTPQGRAQARAAARLLADAGLEPTEIVTSPMVRSVRTAEVVRDVLGRPAAPVTRDWRLVERDYGCLTGMPKAQARRELGPDGFVTVRRTRHGRPPALGAEAGAALDLYEERESGLVPAGAGESLDDVIARVGPTVDRARGRVLAGAVVMLVAHGNSLRAVCTLLDGLTDDEVVHLNIPAAQPLVYRLDEVGRPRPRGGRYLDPEEAREQTARIAAEGGT